jgi:hypothetical protein
LVGGKIMERDLMYTSYPNPFDQPKAKIIKVNEQTLPDRPQMRIVSRTPPSEKDFWFQKYAVGMEDPVGCA